MLSILSSLYTNGTPVGIFTSIISNSDKPSKILIIALKELLCATIKWSPLLSLIILKYDFQNDSSLSTTFLKLSPPLRTESDRMALVQAINDDIIDVIVSDHKPEDEESKRLTFAQAATGSSGIETLLSLSLEMFHNKSVPLKKIIAALTCNPSKVLGINKGSLDEGNSADLCVVDIDKPWVVKKDEIKSKSKNTSIENRKLQGKVIKTFLKGEIVYEGL